MRKLLWLASFTWALSGCVTVPNVTGCAAAGPLRFGAVCAESLTGKKSELSAEEFIEFLEPRVEGPDPEDPNVILPARGGAICFSAEDTRKLITAIEQACKELGKRCSYEVRKAIGAL